ncbi:hypothetical protein, partial [Cohnella thermotolerans]|uniref:hypothetical protein n=1 Tax=Cohnella thermotolerans TaxID=329858 RepID=UPI00055694F2
KETQTLSYMSGHSAEKTKEARLVSFFGGSSAGTREEVTPLTRSAESRYYLILLRAQKPKGVQNEEA